MSHRIQAKIFESDTYTSFLKRLRKILPNINSQNQIGLYHLFFIKQEEDDQLGTIIMKKNELAEDGSKKKYRRHIKSLSMKLQAGDSDNEQTDNNNVKDFVKPPLTEEDIITSLDVLQETQNYLVVYIDQISFEVKNLDGLPPDANQAPPGSEYHDTIPLGKTFYKVLRGKSTANKLLFCSYSDCMREFNETGNLKTHMRKHTGDRPFHCVFENCDKSFITKGHLQTHLLIHTGEKPFKCKICGKDYSRSGRLKIHLRTHTGEKPFKCKDCGKSFTENGNLKTHMRIHTGEKPFRCEFANCGRSFTTQGHLTDHKRKHTNARPYICEICNQSFMRSSTLKMHIKRHAQNEIDEKEKLNQHNEEKLPEVQNPPNKLQKINEMQA